MVGRNSLFVCLIGLAVAAVVIADDSAPTLTKKSSKPQAAAEAGQQRHYDGKSSERIDQVPQAAPATPPPAPLSRQRRQRRAQWEKALQAPAELTVGDEKTIPLGKLLELIREKHGLNVQLDMPHLLPMAKAFDSGSGSKGSGHVALSRLPIGLQSSYSLAVPQAALMAIPGPAYGGPPCAAPACLAPSVATRTLQPGAYYPSAAAAPAQPNLSVYAPAPAAQSASQVYAPAPAAQSTLSAYAPAPAAAGEPSVAPLAPAASRIVPAQFIAPQPAVLGAAVPTVVQVSAIEDDEDSPKSPPQNLKSELKVFLADKDSPSPQPSGPKSPQKQSVKDASDEEPTDEGTEGKADSNPKAQPPKSEADAESDSSAEKSKSDHEKDDADESSRDPGHDVAEALKGMLDAPVDVAILTQPNATVEDVLRQAMARALPLQAMINSALSEELPLLASLTQAGEWDLLVQDNGVLITTRLNANLQKETRVYSIRALEQSSKLKAEDVARVLTRTIRPWSWRRYFPEATTETAGATKKKSNSSTGKVSIPKESLSMLSLLLSSNMPINSQRIRLTSDSEESPVTINGEKMELTEEDLELMSRAWNGLFDATVTSIQVLYHSDPPTGVVEVLPGMLIISQSQSAHREIADLLEQLTHPEN